jgi:hypothetical protein
MPPKQGSEGRDGTYGRAQQRQRYRCTDPAGSFHRFTPPLPRERTADGVCDVCESTVHAHAGPVVSRGYRHRLHLVAEALVAVGRGVSYTRAAQRARVAGGRDPLAGSSSGQMVAEWVDAWAPTILAAHAENEWAETLVLDSTDFWWTNARTGIRRREFAILLAYGYTGPNVGRIWGIHAEPTAQGHDWIRFLSSLDLPGPPASIVADDNLAIEAAVSRMWTPAPGPSLPQPFLFACEHHLRERAKNALEADNAHAGRGLWMRRLDTAFRRVEGWEEFHRATSVLGASAAWTANNDAQLHLQASVRHLLPAHRSTAGADAAAHRLRNLYEQRSFSLRNASRTNLLLGLTRLHLNNRDDVNAYHRILRKAAEAGKGRPRQGQRLNRDPRDGNGNPQPSLR